MDDPGEDHAGPPDDHLDDDLLVGSSSGIETGADAGVEGEDSGPASSGYTGLVGFDGSEGPHAIPESERCTVPFLTKYSGVQQ